MEDNQKACGYIRIDNVSDLAASIKDQKGLLEDFARSRGIHIEEYYIDMARGDIPVDKRDGFIKLKNDIVAGRVNTVVTANSSVLTSNNMETHGIMHEFAEKGVGLFYAESGEYLNPSDPITREQRLLAEAMRKTEEIKAQMLKDRRKERKDMH